MFASLPLVDKNQGWEVRSFFTVQISFVLPYNQRKTEKKKIHQQASSELTKQHKHPADLDDVVLTYLLAICTKKKTTFDNLENR